MSEVQSRGSSTRGRGGFRGGRGGYRGARGGKPHSSRTDEQENIPPLEEQGEVGELKAKYADKLPMLREICVGWSDDDLVMALEDSNGDEMLAMERITSGLLTCYPLDTATSSPLYRRHLEMGISGEEAAQGERHIHDRRLQLSRSRSRRPRGPWERQRC